jgi:amino acid permease
MKEPKHFPNVVKGGMTIVMVIYICMGTLGYLTCKEDCEGSITLNLPGTVYVYLQYDILQAKTHQQKNTTIDSE